MSGRSADGWIPVARPALQPMLVRLSFWGRVTRNINMSWDKQSTEMTLEEVGKAHLNVSKVRVNPAIQVLYVPLHHFQIWTGVLL